MKKRAKGLSVWDLTMMGLGTVVGGSFFLGSSIGLRASGPSIVIAYILGAFLVYTILFSLSEMTVANAAPGSFRTFAQEAYGPAVGFITGWVYWTGMALAMSSESIAVSVLFKIWVPRASVPFLGTVIIVLITLTNLLGAERLSKLESGLSFVKLFSIVGFIVLSLSLVLGIMPGKSPIGLGAVKTESLFPGGIAGIAGSMLIVMFTYAGFEIIGLAAAETAEPLKTVPKAIRYTVISLAGLYILAITFILPLVPIVEITSNESPFVAALTRSGVAWAAYAINIVMVSAILSTMLAATFGLGRMLRSLSAEGHAPAFLNQKGAEIPYWGILFSGGAMLLGLGLAYSLPRNVYIFLVSAGGFSLLFTYVVIVATHFKLRKVQGCPPKGKCQLPWFPYTSILTLAALILIIASMPLVPGQGAGLVAGITLIVFFLLLYLLTRLLSSKKQKRAT